MVIVSLIRNRLLVITLCRLLLQLQTEHYGYLCMNVLSDGVLASETDGKLPEIWTERT